jgi:hypothetical protein
MITKSVSPDDPTTDIAIQKLQLQVVYDYYTRPRGRVSLSVQIPESISPYIVCDKEDLHGRKDGLGDFSRDYVKNTTLTMSAPTEVGGKQFVAWAEGGAWQGEKLVNAQIVSSDAKLSIVLAKDRTLRLVYK